MGDRALQCLAPAWLQPCPSLTTPTRTRALTQTSIAIPFLPAAVWLHGYNLVCQSQFKCHLLREDFLTNLSKICPLRSPSEHLLQSECILFMFTSFFNTIQLNTVHFKDPIGFIKWFMNQGVSNLIERSSEELYEMKDSGRWEPKQGNNTGEKGLGHCKATFLWGMQGSSRQITSLMLIGWFLVDWFKTPFPGELKL